MSSFIRFLGFARPVAGPATQIVAAAVAASSVCAALRIKLVLYEIKTPFDAWWIFRTGLTNSFFDMAVIWCVAAVCLLLLLLTIRLQRLGNAIAWFFFGFAIFCVLLACINIVAVNLIGGSLTVQWIYYADLFRSFTSRSAVRPALNASFFAMMGLSLATWLTVYVVSRHTLRLIQRPTVLLAVLLLGVFLNAGYFVRVSGRLDLSEGNRSYFTNPLLELVTTAVAAPAAGLLRTEDPIVQPQLPPQLLSPNLLPAGLATHSIRNVLLFIMESVGAHYVAGTGPAEAARWTPQIASYGASTVAFRNVYAHAPLSSKSLFSLLTSLYPLFSFEIETVRPVTPDLQTLSGRLKGAGFRTAFFMSGDFEFQFVDSFLDGKGFDLRSDMRSIPCAMPRYVGSTSEWPHLDSVDDTCTAAALTRWIDAQAGERYFAMLWTGNTHWPYFSAEMPAPGAFASDPHLNRYLAAVRSSDAAIGSVLDHLANTGRLDSTLVVVIGDHGEAFGEHGFRIHGNSIYDEETRIPLLLINPRITTPGTNHTIGGMIDISPTILHILGLSPEVTWEGRSLFALNRPDRVFLFAPNQEMVAGYRHGHQKFVYRVARNQAFVYDLANDPAEKHNIADEHSGRGIRGHLAGWLQQQDRRNEKLAR